jgi:hypothetical protein
MSHRESQTGEQYIDGSDTPMKKHRSRPSAVIISIFHSFTPLLIPFRYIFGRTPHSPKPLPPAPSPSPLPCSSPLQPSLPLSSPSLPGPPYLASSQEGRPLSQRSAEVESTASSDSFQTGSTTSAPPLLNSFIDANIGAEADSDSRMSFNSRANAKIVKYVEGIEALRKATETSAPNLSSEVREVSEHVKAGTVTSSNFMRLEMFVAFAKDIAEWMGNIDMSQLRQQELAGKLAKCVT